MNQVGTDRDRRGLEQEVLGGTQATAIMASHGGADERRIHGGGRADDSRGPTDCSRAGGGGARGGYGELMSQGDGEDPEGRGGTDGSDDRRVDPKGGWSRSVRGPRWSLGDGGAGGTRCRMVNA